MEIEVSDKVKSKLETLQTRKKLKNMTIEEIARDIIDDAVDIWLEDEVHDEEE